MGNISEETLRKLESFKKPSEIVRYFINDPEKRYYALDHYLDENFVRKPPSEFKESVQDIHDCLNEETK